VLKLTHLKAALEDERPLGEIAAEYLRLPESALEEIKIIRKSLDARRKDRIAFVYTLAVKAENELALLQRGISGGKLAVLPEKPAQEILFGEKELAGRVIVAGAGPAGLVAASILAQYGYRPLLLERGLPVAERAKAVDAFWAKGDFSPVSNVQFGEGGAGTFSDGKLTTRINDPAAGLILGMFVAAGAPPQIEYENKPHIGTDLLRGVVKIMAAQIRGQGGEIRYLTRLSGLELRSGGIKKVVLAGGEKIDCGALILAIGHSARDTYRELFEQGISMEAKAFSLGVRIEHPQEFIDEAQYGAKAGDHRLGAADYSLVCHDTKTGRGVYSFCMCPGGLVIASSSGEEEVVTNGMSFYQRNSGTANSALAVSVTPEDFGGNPLAGIEFQRKCFSN
jgi:uncharacterized FAD-dependent dehydrogenase